jgi:hypothetical protein
MLRKFTTLFIVLIFCWTATACSSSSKVEQSRNSADIQTAASETKIKDGRYPVQQATYDDVDGTYSLMLLNNNPPLYRTDKLQMARLTDAQISQGEKTYLNVKGGEGVMYLTEDFKIEYVHNVTEARQNPDTGRAESVVVRQESSFWTPFAGALAGQALGSLLFTPQYYVPPRYSPGGVLRGYGGYGKNYDMAAERYRSQYKTQPPAVKNRQTLRTTGNLRSNPSNKAVNNPSAASKSSKSSGSGFGSSRLKNSGKSPSRNKSYSNFGSSRRSNPSRSFGTRRRR